MGKIVISENVTLDGVIQDPTGDEGFERGGWFGQIKDRPEVARLALDDALGAEALLLARGSELGITTGGRKPAPGDAQKTAP